MTTTFTRLVFDVRIDHDHGTTVVSLAGELDIAGVPRLRSVVEGLVSAGHHNIVMDLHDLTFCDSTGLGAFLRFERLLTAAGGTLQLRAPCPTVLRLFEITALGDRSGLIACPRCLTPGRRATPRRRCAWRHRAVSCSCAGMRTSASRRLGRCRCATGP